MKLWSESFPGLVMAACGTPDVAFEVHRQTGRMLRQGGEIHLCFDCGPDGGVYHPCDCEGASDDMAALVAQAREFDQHFNRFEVHGHATNLSGQPRDIDHSHIDGADVHRHPDSGWASFAVTTELRNAYLGGGSGEKQRFTREPIGEQLAYVEPTEDERTFRVGGAYRYVNPAGSSRVTTQRVTKKAYEAKLDELGLPPFTPGSDQKPPEDWSRASFRASMDLYVEAIRRQQVGLEAVLVGPSATLLAANRLMTKFRVQPVYFIEGWTPTGTPWLP